ncbi:MAG: dienelactone hydrolase [Akkermansiaceae bacterium]|jgi:dienelactone hydrolase
MLKSLAVLLAIIATASATVQEQVVSYKDGDTDLEGFFAHDPDVPQTGKSVLIVHQWTGMGDNEKMRARMLASLGYKAFALDIYGKGIRPKPPESGTFASKYKGNRALYRQRLAVGLAQLKELAKAKESDIAAIGYCFGGTGALELARSGTPLAGVVSFHGGLSTQAGMAASKDTVEAKVLVLHGADDPHVSEKEVGTFKEEMKSAKAAIEFVAYPGAVHAFTQIGAGNDNSKGAAYNEEADKKSWEAMQEFFKKVFQLK